ncbi:hypothetical protein ABPG72_010006 [Tetrahymena utriculariae]
MDRANEGKDQLIIIEEKISKVNGEMAVKKYLRGKLLGKGGFAKCYEVTNLETKKVIAAKIIPKQTLTKNRARQKLISEIKIHKSLNHQHVVAFEHVFEDHENVYILLELCTNHTLNELIKRRKRLTELEVQCYVVQIVNALKYLHSHRVIHRDLKLGNLFLNEKMEIKLGDFGLATKLESDKEKKHTICGTPNYIAPEILDGKTGHSYEVDIWSLGVIIYTLIIGKPPFETPDVKTTYKKIRNISYGFPENVPISDQARGLITRILNIDPQRRPSLDEIMSSSFLNTGGTIPKVLPLATLACPPSASYTKQFLPQGNALKLNQAPMRLTDSASQSTTNIKGAVPDASRPLGGTTSNWNQVSSQKDQRPQTQQFQKSDFKTSMSTKNMGSGSQNPLFNQTNAPGLATAQSLNTFTKTKNNFNSIQKGFMQTGTQNFGKPVQPVWVTQWVDYSAKYGLGYLLSNGCSGVFFNDSTKVILDPTTNNIEYIERLGNERQDFVQQFTLKDYPPEMKKKVTLLSHFKSYLEEQMQKQNIQIEVPEFLGDLQPYVYVKKWMKTKHAIMFRLSNKIVQVSFQDKTEILLSSENKMVTYVDRKGTRTDYPLSTALESSNTEMSKRLKYTKDILTHMLNNNNTNNNNGRGSLTNVNPTQNGTEKENYN